MTILERLNSEYGENKVGSVCAFLLMQDAKRYENFKQYITLTEYTSSDNSTYKIDLAEKAKSLYGKDQTTIEIINLLLQTNTLVKRYNTVITYGTFDLFHIGHLNLLKRIKAMCNNLIVAVSTDEFNLLKGKKCVIPFEQRFAIVEACKYVDKVIPENGWEQKPLDIKKYNVDAFIMGSDWTGKFDELKEYCDVVYLDRTEGISTTMLKNKLK